MCKYLLVTVAALAMFSPGCEEEKKKKTPTRSATSQRVSQGSPEKEKGKKVPALPGCRFRVGDRVRGRSGGPYGIVLEIFWKRHLPRLGYPCKVRFSTTDRFSGKVSTTRAFVYEEMWEIELYYPTM